MKFLNPPIKAFLNRSTTVYKFSFILWAVFLMGSLSSLKATAPMPLYIQVYNWTVWTYPMITAPLMWLAHNTYNCHNHEDTLKQLWFFNFVMVAMLGYGAIVSLFPLLMLLIIPLALVFRRIPKVMPQKQPIYKATAKVQRRAAVSRVPRTNLSKPLPS